MSAGRAIQPTSPCAFRTVIVDDGNVRHFGPYSTLGAAKGKRTQELKYRRRYSRTPETLRGWIEKTADGWTKVHEDELADN